MVVGGGLSRREREVAELVAEGLTNREIAERLVISERTAEGHVEQIRNKLGFRSRSQVASWVVAERSSGHALAEPRASPVAAAAQSSAVISRGKRRRWTTGVALLATVFVVAAVTVSTRTAAPALELVAGLGTDGFSGDGGPALSAQLSEITSIVFGPTGSLLVADSRTPAASGKGVQTHIRRIDGRGTIRSINGENQQGGQLSFTTSTSATTLFLSRGAWIALGPEQRIYISNAGDVERGPQWIGRMDPDGHFTWLAGGAIAFGIAPLQGDLLFPRGLTVDRTGVVYVAEGGRNRILSIAPDGAIATVAGSGERGSSGDGGPASAATFFAPLTVKLSPDDSLYVVDTNNHRIRAIDHGGTVVPVGGDGTQGFGGDGGPASKARLSVPSDIAFGRDGTLYIADTGNARIRAVTPDGTITTVAGPQGLSRPTALAVHPDGTLYIGDSGVHQILKLKR